MPVSRVSFSGCPAPPILSIGGRGIPRRRLPRLPPPTHSPRLSMGTRTSPRPTRRNEIWRAQSRERRDEAPWTRRAQSRERRDETPPTSSFIATPPIAYEVGLIRWRFIPSLTRLGSPGLAWTFSLLPSRGSITLNFQISV